MGGCCGKPVSYNYNGESRTIAAKDAQTLERFSQGANGRIQAKHLREEKLRELANVPAPSLGKTKGAPLMTDKEFDAFMRGEGKNLVFNNYFQKIDGNCEYRGQWATDRKNWQGLGEITYKSGDVSRYVGQT
jgi:hypothetical protein